MRYVVLLTVAMLAAPVVDSVAIMAADQPETVMVTLRPKAGAEDALAQVIDRHYETARTLHLLRDDMPHLTLRGVDDTGKPYFLEVFTWRDGSVPDSAPQEIQAIWKEMNDLVESRLGRRGLEFTEMSIVQRQPR
jgi:hypothetical protein